MKHVLLQRQAHAGLSSLLLQIEGRLVLLALVKSRQAVLAAVTMPIIGSLAIGFVAGKGKGGCGQVRGVQCQRAPDDSLLLLWWRQLCQWLQQLLTAAT